MNLYLFLALTSALVLRAYTRNSLTPLGILAAVLTACFHALSPSNLPFLLLITFYTLGTVATKVNHAYKSTLTITSTLTLHPPGRTATQVFANSIFASICAVLHSRTAGECGPSIWLIGVIAHYAATTADTLGSELGILSKQKPRLVTTGKVCPPGTNGGVTAWGLFCGSAGAAAIGAVAAVLMPWCDATPLNRFELVLFSSVVGTLGSLLDSLLGAVCQESVIDVRTGRIVEAPGGGKVLVAPGEVSLTHAGKAKAKATGAPEEAEDATTVKEGRRKEGSRKVLVGKPWLTNNGVNAMMAGAVTVGGMLGWAVWRGHGVEGFVGEAGKIVGY